MACAPSEGSDQLGHPPSLIRVFIVCMKKAWVLSYPLSTQQKLWSDWVDAQVDPSLRWAQLFCWFCHEAAHLWIAKPASLSLGRSASYFHYFFFTMMPCCATIYTRMYASHATISFALPLVFVALVLLCNAMCILPGKDMAGILFKTYTLP